MLEIAAYDIQAEGMDSGNAGLAQQGHLTLDLAVVGSFSRACEMASPILSRISAAAALVKR